MNANQVKAAALAIEKARFWAIRCAPFYSQLCMSLSDVFTSDIPTARTNGRVIKWNPEFVLALSEPEQRFVLLHETLHCAHGHLWRFPAKFADGVTNEGCDHAINLYLSAVVGMQATMPKGGCADPRFEGMAEEEIIKVLRQERQGQPQPQSKDDPCGGYEQPADEQEGAGGGEGDEDVEGEEQQPGKQGKAEEEDEAAGAASDEQGDGDGGADGEAEGEGKGQGKGKAKQGEGKGSGEAWGEEGEEEGAGDGEEDFDGEPMPAVGKESLKDIWERRLVESAMTARALGRGDCPGDILRAVERVKATRIDWRREMADFVKSVTSQRNDWSRSSRRHAWQPVIYPRRRADDIGLTVFVRDTSGSIGGAQMNAFSAMIADCMAETNCPAVVIDCDDVVQQEVRLEQGDEVPLTSAGGGGTDFRPPFLRVQELVDEGERISGLVYLTDLYGPEPETVDIPVLWLCVNERKAKTGTTVQMEM